MRKIWKTLVLVVLMTSLSGCSTEPKGDPMQIITEYYQNIKDGNFEVAYSKLTFNSQSNITEEEYDLYQNLMREITTLIDVKITAVLKDEIKTIDGVEFEKIKAFDVITTEITKYDMKENTYTVRRYIVGEEGFWKLHSQISRSDISRLYARIGSMYMYGEGKELNLIEAVINFRQSLVYDESELFVHYYIGDAYYKMQRYDESILECDIVLKQSLDVLQQSDALNLIALDYIGLKKMAEAKDAFKRAIELNPNNEYAKNNLAYYFK